MTEEQIREKTEEDAPYDRMRRSNEETNNKRTEAKIRARHLPYAIIPINSRRWAVIDRHCVIGFSSSDYDVAAPDPEARFVHGYEKCSYMEARDAARRLNAEWLANNTQEG